MVALIDTAELAIVRERLRSSFRSLEAEHAVRLQTANRQRGTWLGERSEAALNRAEHILKFLRLSIANLDSAIEAAETITAHEAKEAAL